MTIKHQDQALDTHVSVVSEKENLDNCSNLTIVLDIDEVLAVPDRIRDGEEGAKIAQYAQAFDIQYFVCCEHNHFLLPGCIEFMRFLADLPGVTIHFCSSGRRIRNIEFVPKLLDLAWNDVKYDALREKVQIKSREDIEYTYRKDEYSPDIDHFYGNLKKDLRVLDLSPSAFKNAILFDDDISYVTRAQQFNFIHVPTWMPSISWECLKKVTDISQVSPEALKRGFNGLFFASGFLLTILEEVASQNSTIQKVIKRLHYKPDPEAYRENYELVIVPTLDDESMSRQSSEGTVLVTLEDNKIKYCTIGRNFRSIIDYITEEDFTGIKIPTSIDGLNSSILKDQILEVTSNRNHTHVLEMNFDNCVNKHYYAKGLEKLREYNPTLHLITSRL